MHATAERTPVKPALLENAIRRACGRIAPTWPLDRFIAVNPYWGFREQPIGSAGASLARLSGTTLTMPREFYREQWQAGRLRREHLEAAIDARGSAWTADELLHALENEPTLVERLPLVTDLVDARRDLRHAMAWRDYVTHQVSQFCAAYFDDTQAQWQPDRRGGLYAAWRRQVEHDHAPRLLMGFRGFRDAARRLPDDARTLTLRATDDLGIEADGAEPYFTALLLSINGWAAWCAWLGWEARLAGGDDRHIEELLAIRLAWEWMLAAQANDAIAEGRWATTWRDGAHATDEAIRRQEADWLLQSALEFAYQSTLCSGLAAAPQSADLPAPEVQAVFCIDVRSEVFRRALEARSPAVQTLGFAGFFGLPIAYRAHGSALARPQLPGLLGPALEVTDRPVDDATADDVARRRTRALDARERWREFRSAASSGFSFVEACGLAYAGKLLKNSLPSLASRPRPVEQAGLSEHDLALLRPHLAGSGAAGGTSVESRAALAARVLGAMGLTEGFARLVLITGHGSTTANNPHAAGLDCGACGGQTGEVNARALAALLNDADVRTALRAQGIAIPETTRFVGGLHDTTTDEVRLFDLEDLSGSHAPDLERLREWLAQAGDQARAERAASLGLGRQRADTSALRRAIRARSGDWSEVRPEWGLANNAAFVVAPRSRTRHLNLEGRVFLHDYAWQKDPGFATLELIMTAPMIVTNWINLQYYASTVDNRRYGSGNKVLHNVVGGRIGVFEGNGGDLRIGLPMQSLHDGGQWQHTPLRLSVFIEAPQAPVERIIAAHETVRQLIENEWLHLFRIDPEGGDVLRYRAGAWEVAARAATPA